ncbi:helix-turn-helix domain-containing protein [Phenylobacterium sp. SCN 70-31]
MTGVSRSSLYKLIKAGDLRTFTWCGRTLIRAEELVRHLDQASRAA